MPLSDSGGATLLHSDVRTRARAQSSASDADASLRWLAGLGFVGSACVLTGASLPGSPFVRHVAGSWLWTPPGATGPEGDAQFLGVFLVYTGIIVLLAAWLELVRRARSAPGPSRRGLVGALVAWALPIAVSPPLFSLDVYSYAAQGEMVSRGINPYLHGPSSLGADAFTRLADPRWAHTTAPYGPGWERLGGWLVELAGHGTVASVLAFRATAVLGVALLAWAIPSVAHALGARSSLALTVGVLNPLVLLVLLGGAHNDALMLGLLAASCALAARRRVLVGLLVCALAAEVKAPALMAAAFIGWAWWPATGAQRRLRAARALTAVVISGGAMLAVSALAGLGWRWIPDLVAPGGVTSWLDPATAAGLAIGHAANALGAHVGVEHFVTALRVVGLAVALAISARLLAGCSRRTAPSALGWSLLVLALLGPIVWPWYEAWGFVFLAIAAEGWTLRVVVALSAVACFADVQSPHLLVAATPAIVVPCWAALAVAIATCLWHARAERSHRPAPAASARVAPT